MNYKIEKNIPMVEHPNAKKKKSIYCDLMKLVGDMIPGDSILLDNLTSNRINFWLTKIKKQTNKRFTIRTVSKTHKRLWRIE